MAAMKNFPDDPTTVTDPETAAEFSEGRGDTHVAHFLMDLENGKLLQVRSRDPRERSLVVSRSAHDETVPQGGVGVPEARGGRNRLPLSQALELGGERLDVLEQ